jgi:hypothetical protein
MNSARTKLGKNSGALKAILSKLEKSKVIKFSLLSSTIYCDLFPSLFNVWFLTASRGKGFNVRDNTIKCYDPRNREAGWTVLPAF